MLCLNKTWTAPSPAHCHHRSPSRSPSPSCPGLSCAGRLPVYSGGHCHHPQLHRKAEKGGYSMQEALGLKGRPGIREKEVYNDIWVSGLKSRTGLTHMIAEIHLCDDGSW